MSLINKMLQDLDARGGAPAGKLQQEELKAVPAAERDTRRLLVLAAASAALVALAAGGWFGWRYWQGRAAPPLGPVPKVNVTPPEFVRSPVPAPSAAAVVAAAEVVAPAHPDPSAAERPPAPAQEAPRAPLAAAPTGELAATVSGGRRQRERRQAVPASAGVLAPGRELGPTQLAENTYRRALLALSEGRLSEAFNELDRALEIDPRNDAARQTYISLLLENRRPDDAIRQLRLALDIDPHQPGLAMLLARMQLERGGPALDTLMRALPGAGNNADYQALLAGVLQREQRNGEAAEHYQQALHLQPGNSVWWMGLGISLQAEKRLPESRAAFEQARATGGLSPELQTFVERKLTQLAR